MEKVIKTSAVVVHVFYPECSANLINPSVSNNDNIESFATFVNWPSTDERGYYFCRQCGTQYNYSGNIIIL